MKPLLIVVMSLMLVTAAKAQMYFAPMDPAGHYVNVPPGPRCVPGYITKDPACNPKADGPKRRRAKSPEARR
jgi:hypothetical protein